MIINNKENNKDGKHQHITNEHLVRLSPPLEGLGEVFGGGFSAVILAAGDFPTHVLPLHILRTAENLIVCDGALEDLLEYDIEPTAVVGDGDSLSEELKQRYAHIYHPISEQEFNDLASATLELRESVRITPWATYLSCSITIVSWLSTQ